MKNFLIRCGVIYLFVIPFAVVMWLLNENDIIDVNILVCYGILLYGVILGMATLGVSILLEELE